MLRRRYLAATVLGVALLAVAPVSGVVAGRPTGISITPVSAAGMDVTFDVTLNTTGTSPIGTFGSPVGFIGDLWSFQYTLFSATVTNRYVHLNPRVDAVDFGDGAGTIDATTIPMVSAGPPGSFTGSFMHTYPAGGTYTATVGANRLAGPATAAAPATTGSLIVVPAGQGISFQRYLLPTYTVPSTITGMVTADYVFGIQNSIGVDVGGIVDVPVAGPLGLAALTLLIAVAAIWVFRRNTTV